MSKTTEKADGAFRTIREVADWLGVPTHVLRFWESKFDQIAPVKGSGGRRYYRPEDMRLLGGIKVLLHDRGQTIRAVAQQIDDDGTAPVMELSPPLEVAAATTQRTRRVIRPGDEPAPARPRPVAIDPEAVAPPEPDPADLIQQPDAPRDGVELASAPDDGAPTDAPGFLPSGEPEAPPPEPPQPDLLPDADASQPADPEPAEPDPAPADDADVEPAAEPAVSTRNRPAPAPSNADAPPPSLVALRLVREHGAALPRGDRRMRRIVRRLRGLIDDVAEDLAS